MNEELHKDIESNKNNQTETLEMKDCCVKKHTIKDTQTTGKNRTQNFRS
jgi:hypothetical protein